MSMRQLLERAKMSLEEWMASKPKPDATPVEVTPRLGLGAFNSLDTMRQAIALVSREKELAGDETFEEFWNFEDDVEFADLEDMPAPAQLKAHGIISAFTRDFKGEIANAEKAARVAARDRLKAELRRELAEEDRAIAAKGSSRGGVPEGDLD